MMPLFTSSNKIYFHESPESFTSKELRNLSEFQYLIFNHEDFNESLKNIPNNITRIQFMLKSSTCTLLHVLPDKLEKLTFGNYFDQPLDNLPESLIQLDLGENFTQYLDNLPHHLEYLEIGHQFNHPINNLPMKLTHLKIGKSFNHPIDNLPPNLVLLKFYHHSCFNNPINNLPNKLQTIELGSAFYQDINNLPDSLEKIIIYNDNYDILITRLPSNLNEICISLNYPWYEELTNLANIINAKIFYI